MKYSVSELAKRCGVTVRTLHYYDEIGLLSPSQVTEAGYRCYDQQAAARLQQILFYRELDFSLKEIRQLLQLPDAEQKQALRRHRELLLLKRQRLDDLVELVDATLGGNTMSKKQITTMEEIDAVKQKYADEVRQRWGGTRAYEESQQREAAASPYEKIAAAQETADIFEAFAAIRSQDPAGPQAQQLVKRWQDFISGHYYTCTDQILEGLGQMYVGDQRFTENLDNYGQGTAAFMSAAIAAYCRDRK